MSDETDTTKAKLIDAAAGLFADRGFRETSVQAIQDASGVSRGSIFWHFGSKEGLLWAVVERAFARFETDLLLPGVGDATGLEAVRRALAAHRAFLERDRDVLRLFYVLMYEAMGSSGREELVARYVSLHRRLRELLAGWIVQGVASGEIDPDADATALVTMLIGTLGGLAYQYLLDPEGVALEPVYAQMTASIERSLTRT